MLCDSAIYAYYTCSVVLVSYDCGVHPQNTIPFD